MDEWRDVHTVILDCISLPKKTGSLSPHSVALSAKDTIEQRSGRGKL